MNELESLEADHYSSYSNLKKDAIDNQIRMYYEAVLKDLIDEKFIKCKHRIKKMILHLHLHQCFPNISLFK